MEQEKFSNDIEPWVRIEHYLGVALYPAWWTKDSLFFSLFLPHTFTLFHRRGKKNLPIGQRTNKFPLDSFLSLLCYSKMISSRVLERRESGKNLFDLVTEQSDNSLVTQDEPFDVSFIVYPLHPSEVEEGVLLDIKLCYLYNYIYLYI